MEDAVDGGGGDGEGVCDFSDGEALGVEGEDVGGDIRLEGIGERCDELCLDAESVHDFEAEYAFALRQIQSHCIVLVVDDRRGARFELTNVVGGRHGCLRIVDDLRVRDFAQGKDRVERKSKLTRARQIRDRQGF